MYHPKPWCHGIASPLHIMLGVCHLACHNGLAWFITQHNGQELHHLLLDIRTFVQWSLKCTTYQPIGPNKSIWIYYGIMCLISWMSYYLCSFDINYIIFKDFEILKKKSSKKKRNCEKKYWILKKLFSLLKWKFQN